MESVSDVIYHPIDKRRVLCQTGQRFGATFFGFFFIHHHHHHRGAAAFWEIFFPQLFCFGYQARHCRYNDTNSQILSS